VWAKCVDAECVKVQHCALRAATRASESSVLNLFGGCSAGCFVPTAHRVVINERPSCSKNWPIK
jgi:hypothetical protein